MRVKNTSKSNRIKLGTESSVPFLKIPETCDSSLYKWRMFKERNAIGLHQSQKKAIVFGV